ncbi:hypothetical protein I552_5270 [Mycobacterium xenopi 3993]|nr:hypothetical protein I552_5270 [Mycobacterium xenopi 3993]
MSRRSAAIPTPQHVATSRSWSTRRRVLPTHTSCPYWSWPGWVVR